MRTAIEVDRVKLTTAIVGAELQGPLKNRSLLHEAVAELYNKSNPPRPITASVVMLRIKDWNLTVQTPMGKRGRSGPMTAEHKAALVAGRSGKRTKRSEKFAKNPELKAGFDELRKKVPERYIPLVDRLENGSAKAGIVLHCLDCVGYCTKEVRQCSAGVQMCALWPLRPYQKADADEDEALAETLEAA